MDIRKRIIIALDYPNAREAEALLSHWEGKEKPFIKVGYQLFYRVGPEWVIKRKEEGYSIFLDLKLHDIPNTVAKGVESISQLGVDFLTVHASGGRKMMEAAREAAEKSARGQRVQLLAVTQLTSTDQPMLNEEIGIPGSITDCVTRYARLAYQAGADGVICSGQEAGLIKQVTASDFLAVTPGVRPLGDDVQDQKRVVTPTQAIKNGADYLVIGRPITQAPSPVKAYEAILAEIKQAWR
ncbi:orotidine-5'-phosphate decarboxylase [Thermoflavimicrobium dichotomicum]|uniref:Orotidine 5'-phosphate decarboxylase n=1 Tax=Thermoflavimicrobium dichotomicum TaxID=46223 RepID=A0A1I3SWN2_9BACL|nr:orotidine-5'-phosphate decarboxylase [Thermoflavimicrobium dichotomicum]SFJ62783.1 orotidine-5'-phosphate decarboxylase [Thermoflavimicrobium dichotomicum]